MKIANFIKGIGEVVLRVNDLEACTDFYQNVIGFELMHKSPGFTFFKIAEGYRGHTQVLALFDKENTNNFGERLEEVSDKKGNQHHFALEIDLENYDLILEKIRSLNIQYQLETFSWVKWRSIFIKDPENNVVEFVCYDERVL